MKTRLIGILTLVALVCAVPSLTGCKQKEPAAPDANKPAPDPTKTAVEPTKPAETQVKPVALGPVTTTTPPPNAVLVTVNGTDITQKQLDALIKPVVERYTQKGGNLPPAFLEQQKKMLKQQALQEMIRMALLNEKVKLANITITDQDITDEIARVAASQKITLEEFKQKMITRGFDIEQMKSQIRTVLGQQKLMAKEFPEEAKFTEEDAKAYYEANKARYETPEQVRASHILITSAPSDPSSDPNEAKAVAKAKADDLLKQIKEGADFAALAKTNSQDPQSAVRGGDLDFFPRGRMVPPFDKVAFELQEVGNLSEVVETDYGFHIIKLTGKKEAATTPYEEVKDAIIAEQAQRKLRDLALKYVEKLEAEAKIAYAPGMEPKPIAPPQIPGAPGIPGGPGGPPR